MNRREKINEVLTDLECRKITRFEAIEKIEKITRKKEIGQIDESLKEKIREIASFYASKIHNIRNITDAASHNISLRLRSFSVDECKMAIDNFSRDAWNMSNNGHRGLEWFFHKDERVETYMRMRPKNNEGKEDVIRVGTKTYLNEKELIAAEGRGEIWYDDRKHQYFETAASHN